MIADFEAGVGTLLRADAKQVDLVIIVVEPYKKSIETARRLIEIARENSIDGKLIVANKVRDGEDLELISRGLGGVDVDLVVPADEEIASADLHAVAPIDHAPASPAVQAISSLALRLAG